MQEYEKEYFDMNSVGRSLYQNNYNISKRDLKQADIEKISDDIITKLNENISNINYRDKKTYFDIFCNVCLLAFVNNCDLNKFIQISKKD